MDVKASALSTMSTFDQVSHAKCKDDKRLQILIADRQERALLAGMKRIAGPNLVFAVEIAEVLAVDTLQVPEE